MRSAKTSFLVMLLFALALSACNLPVSAVGAPTSSIAPVAVLTAAAECWSAPGEGYSVVGALSPGQAAEVVGRTPDGAYLLIRDPANPAVLCWLKGAVVTVVGDLVSLPVYGTPSPPTLVGGCPSPVPSGPTPVVCSAPIAGGCPSPVPSGPTPVSCTGPVVMGCPSPVPSGPTPVSCSAFGSGPSVVGCPSPVPSGPTPVSCSGSSGPLVVAGCPSPVPSGPTPVSCSAFGSGPSVVGFPSPIGGGPTPVDCSGSGGAPPPPIPGVKPRNQPTPVEAPSPVGGFVPVRGPTTVP